MINTGMSKRTNEMLFLERNPSTPIRTTELRRLILGGLLGPAVRVRYAEDSEFWPLGVLPEFKLLFKQVQPERHPLQQGRYTPWLIWIGLGAILRLYSLGLKGEWHWQLQGRLMNDYASVVELGEWYRIWTAALVHQSLGHMLLNLCLLGYVGFQIEARLGQTILAWIVGLSTGVGSLFSLLYAPHSASIGASASVYALLTFAVGFGLRHPKDPAARSEHLGWFVLPYLILAIALGFLSSNIDHAGHLGGFLVGVVFVWRLPTASNTHFHVAPRRWWQLPSLLSVAAVMLLCSLIWKGESWVVLARHHDAQGLSIERPSYWKSGWGSTGEQAWLSPTAKAQLVVDSIVLAKPQSVVRQRLLQHLQQMGRVQETAFDGAMNLGGTEGWYWSGHVNQVDGERAVWIYVLCRGQLEHYMIMSAAIDKKERYEPYWLRMMQSVQLELPEQLKASAAAAKQSDASAEDLVAYADGLYRIGHVPAALELYEQGLTRDPSSTDAMLGRIRCLDWLHDPMLEGAVLEALPWLSRSESLARITVPLLNSAQLEYWLPQLQLWYPNRRWRKLSLAPEE